MNFSKTVRIQTAGIMKANDVFFQAQFKSQKEISRAMEVKDHFDIKYLSLLSENYPTIHDASTEIINLQAIMQLPKGTEHFLSDLHGEHEAFTHIINNASGEIRQKVDKLFSNILTSSERAQFSTLIYYPEEKLKEIKETDLPDMDEWYKITLHRLIDLCHLISSKYSRSRVRKSLPPDFDFVIDELINAEKTAREEYYECIIDTIVDIGNADEFIVALASVAKRLIVDRLHIVGDLFDRGSRPDIIIDMLSQHHAVDIQWGNHDVLWMGAASGSMACISVVLNNSIKYGNMDCLETAYGINLRPLAIFAQENYIFSRRFNLKQTTGSVKSQDSALMSKMYEAISLIQIKLEGQIIRRHPEYHMSDRLLLDKIDFKSGIITIDDHRYPLDVSDFPELNPEDPYQLTPQEQQVMEQLVLSFKSSYKLQRQIRFLYATGSIYRLFNNNLLFHGCMPMNEDGTFQSFVTHGKSYAGKSFFDFADKMARLGYYAQEDTQEKQDGEDFLWFLWCGKNSPLFGRDRITTFERLFIDDPAAWIEKDNPYYSQIENLEICKSLFDEFKLNWETGHIINGHVPVNVKGGESPIKGGGKIIVIDGGFCKAYQKKTGIAGYTLIYDSHGMRIASHEPFSGTMNAIKKNSDILSQEMIFETPVDRLTVADTDAGTEIKARTEELKVLLQAYRLGIIKERNPESK